jgi:hypothetical protein
MPGVPRELIEHELHLDPKAKPIKRRLHRCTQDKKHVIKKEIARLLDTGFIKEVSTQIGSPIPILLRHAKKIPLASPRSIRSWTPQSVVAF